MIIDRSEGSASLNNGSLELMIHRRLQTESIGVCPQSFCAATGLTTGGPEPPNDPTRVLVKHWLLVGSPAKVNQDIRPLSVKMYNPLNLGAS